jgi:hypothetical protein
MNRLETAQLLKEIAVIDNRKVTEELIDGWHAIIKHVPFDIGQESHKLARRNPSVTYLEPKHIVSYAQEAAYSLDRQKPKVDYERPIDIAPQPTCREHGKKIMTCDPCCRKLSPMADKPAAEILVFAKKFVYA